MIQRYKIQQAKGQYCLKGCDDGDLMDYASHAAIIKKIAAGFLPDGSYAGQPIYEIAPECFANDASDDHG